MKTKAKVALDWYSLPCPGDTLGEALVEKEVYTSDLADQTGYSDEYILRVYDGRSHITQGFAEALERVLGISANFWLSLQANYEVDLLDLEAKEDSMAKANLERGKDN